MESKSRAPADARSGAGTVTWKIHREIVLVLAWGRAVLLQFAHPLIASGVGDHSAFGTECWGHLRRLQRTLDAMLRLTFGTAEDARGIARRINAIHDRVHGCLREAAGIFPAGTTYSARDPALLRWVHGTLIDSHLIVYELYVGPLTVEEKDRYCVEASGVEQLLGIPEGALPRSFAELGEYMERMLASGEIAVTERARALARAVVVPSVPRLARPGLRLIQLPTIGLLPPAIREAYGFPWSPGDELALYRSARAIRALLPLVPSLVREWPAARAAGATRRGRSARHLEEDPRRSAGGSDRLRYGRQRKVS